MLRCLERSLFGSLQRFAQSRHAGHLGWFRVNDSGRRVAMSSISVVAGRELSRERMENVLLFQVWAR